MSGVKASERNRIWDEFIIKKSHRDEIWVAPSFNPKKKDKGHCLPDIAKLIGKDGNKKLFGLWPMKIIRINADWKSYDKGLG